MQDKVRPSFAFLVVTYNHQDYILEHLESIKFLVQAHGEGLNIDLIVNDDCSKDNTRNLVDQWLQLNVVLFRHIKTIYNPQNLGTCASVNNMLSHVVADRCKITAGDDVYSFENIFELTQHTPDVAILSGRALHLFGDQLGVDRISDILTFATQVIYENDTLLHRFKHISYSNAPNILYATECLLHPNVRAYLVRFDVTEDWPLQVAIARQFPERRFKLIDKVLVYYRRTVGSTYIVANQRFVKDKIKIYDDLISNENLWLERLRLASRKFCFRVNGRFMKRIFNIDLYFYTVASMLSLNKYLFLRKTSITNIEKHRSHYVTIKNNAKNASNVIFD